MAEPFISQITLFGNNYPVRGWAYCEGQLLSIAQHSALFSLLGTIWGGDGSTTFALPDLRGRVPLHPGHGPGLTPYQTGQKGGVEHVTLTTSEIPSHDHSTAVTIKASNDNAGATDPTGAFLATGVANYATTEGRGLVDMNSEMVATTVGNTGGGREHENRQPWLAINFQIAMQGIFPSRS